MKLTNKKDKIKKILSGICESWNGAIKLYVMPYKWEYLFGGLFMLLILFSTMYFDFFATFRDGINFWYALFEGHPLSFYSYAAAIPGRTPNREVYCGAAYDFTIYGFFAIWNFPVWLYERISGKFAESCLLCMMWAKLMLPVIAIVIARGMKKILEFISSSGRDTAAMIYAYFFSGILIMAAYSVGQYDIIGVLFAVYGVYYFLKKDYKRFYLYFGVAITCKYFAVFLFVCLVLLHEKRILYIIRNLAGGCYLVFIEKLLFSFGKSYDAIHAPLEQAAKSYDAIQTPLEQAVTSGGGAEQVVGVSILSSRIQYLFHLRILMGVDSMSVFMFLMALVWVYCYLQKREETYAFYYKVIYIGFCVNAVFILFTASTPYWAIVLVPYMILMIYCRTGNRKINICLETIGVGSFLVWHFAREPYLFYSGNCEGMLLYYLLGKPFFYGKGLSAAMATLFEEGKILASPINMLRSVYYVCMLILLIINFPAFNKGENDFADRQEEVGMRGLLAFRMVCMVGVLLLPLAGYVIQVVFAGYFSSLQTENPILMDILQNMLN